MSGKILWHSNQQRAVTTVRQEVQPPPGKQISMEISKRHPKLGEVTKVVAKHQVILTLQRQARNKSDKTILLYKLVTKKGMEANLS